MNIENLKKLYRVRVNNKNFQIFLNKENKLEIYLELKNNNHISYDYPDIKDYKKICNIIRPKFILNSNPNKNRFKQGTINFGHQLIKYTTAFGVVTILMVATFVYVNQDFTFFTFTGAPPKEVLEYNEKETISTLEDLFNSKYAYLLEKDVTFDEVISAIDNNQNLNAYEKKTLKEYITTINQKYPNQNLAIFYHHCKNLTIEHIDTVDNPLKPQGEFDPFYSIIKLDKTLYGTKKGRENFLHETEHMQNQFYQKMEDGKEIYISLLGQNNNLTAVGEALATKAINIDFDLNSQEYGYQFYLMPLAPLSEKVSFETMISYIRNGNISKITEDCKEYFSDIDDFFYLYDAFYENDLVEDNSEESKELIMEHLEKMNDYIYRYFFQVNIEKLLKNGFRDTALEQYKKERTYFIEYILNSQGIIVQSKYDIIIDIDLLRQKFYDQESILLGITETLNIIK